VSRRHDHQQLHLRNQMIQLIDKQDKVFTMLIHDVECKFIPMSLYIGNSLQPAKSFVRGARLYWRVADKQVSYNQIKAAIGEIKSVKKQLVTPDPITTLFEQLQPNWL